MEMESFKYIQDYSRWLERNLRQPARLAWCLIAKKHHSSQEEREGNVPAVEYKKWKDQKLGILDIINKRKNQNLKERKNVSEEWIVAEKSLGETKAYMEVSARQ